MALTLPIEPAANELLRSDPLALLVGMVLDQQVTMEKAFSSPYELRQRLGHELSPRELAEFDADELSAIFSRPPALHRFPKANARSTKANLRPDLGFRPLEAPREPDRLHPAAAGFRLRELHPHHGGRTPRG